MKLVQLPVMVAVLVIVAAAVFVTVNVRGGISLSAGPVEVVWDHEICAHCRMHVGDPAFAAQVQTAAGEVLNFDDSGCAFQWLADHPVELHALYFHHRDQNRWLDEKHVAFAAVAQSPMGFGFAAVDAGTPGALSITAARERMLQPRTGR